MKPNVDRYLARGAQPDEGLVREVSGSFGHVLVVPAYAEAVADVATMLSSVAAGPLGATLVLVVVNSRTDSSDADERDNVALIEWLERQEPGFGQVRVIERTARTSPLPAAEGVGLARKIGADTALALHAAGVIASDWIHFTDADAILPAQYFERAPTDGAPVALVYPFVHEDADPQSHALGLAYECWMRSYVGGLRRAGSPYAFHTVGSTIVVRADAYAAVRGVPRRNAAEDFYLLNKLAKTGPVKTLDGSPIRLQARRSDRVPFGTGRALTHLHGSDPLRAPVYDDRIFDHLGALLGALGSLAQDDGRSLDAVLLPESRSVLGPTLEHFAVGAALTDACARATSPAARLDHMHTWLDGFRTLKIVNHLRGQFPDIELRQCAQRLGVAEDPAVVCAALSAV